MRMIFPLMLSLACREAELPICQQDFTMDPNGDASRTVTLVDDALPGPLVLQLVIPWEEARYTHGAPGAVFVHGGWTSDIIPLGDDQAHLVGATGAWSIYVNLPGGGGTMSSGGENDRRGSDSRQAIGAALRYSAGMLEDNSGCRIDDRMPTGIAEERVLAAFSNGGNLAWATLADPDVALPDIHGIVVFETPASSQMALGEPGTGNRTSPLHTEGSCHIDEDSALVCDYDYENLAFDMNTDPDTAGTLFLDVDQDGFYSDKIDFPLGLAKAEDNENWAHSLQAMEAVESAKLITRARLNSQDTAEFWQWREAPRAVPAAIERFPDLAGMSIGTEIDHVLEGATDHPHVIGMVEAMQRSNMRWTRLQPDRSYVESLAQAEFDYIDLDANIEIRIGDPNLPMEPEDDAGVRGSDYLTAGVLELLDRSWRQDWSVNLSAVLVESAE